MTTQHADTGLNNAAIATCLQSMEQELHAILHFWQHRMPDSTNGGFLGAIHSDGTADTAAPKGAVLHARILWTFATAAKVYRRKDYQDTAQYAFEYFTRHFVDREYGGVCWSLNPEGKVIDSRKQTYAQAFAIYGLSAYYALTHQEEALSLAINLFDLLEAHARDHQYGGYIEALNESWGALEDMRLSEKDANEPKSMNTHLHVLEAYTALLQIWPNERLRAAIIALLQVFRDHIISHDFTQGLFFGMQWDRRDEYVSFGHDIESSWLLHEAALATGDPYWMQYTSTISVKMAAASCRGIDQDGGMWHEYNGRTQHLLAEKHWWPQAEALVGFCNAWQLSGDGTYLQRMQASWHFITQRLIHAETGEWLWGVYADYSPMDQEDLAGFWKCPYHNGRALMEVLHRLQDFKN